MSDACGATCGITRERARQRDAARALSLRVLDGELDPDPWSDADVDALVARWTSTLPCRATVTAGERARWIYLVATVDDATWAGLREGASRAPSGPQTAVRVGLSAFGRYATLQEVRHEGAPEGDGWWIEESRCVGVEDPRLQSFVKVAQGTLRSMKVAVLDAAFLGEPCGAGRDETVWEALFDADPMNTRTGACAPGVGVEGHALTEA